MLGISWPYTQAAAKFIWLLYKCMKQVTKCAEFFMCTSCSNTLWCVQSKGNFTFTINIWLTRMYLMTSIRNIKFKNCYICKNSYPSKSNMCFWNLRGALVITCFLKKYEISKHKEASISTLISGFTAYVENYFIWKC